MALRTKDRRCRKVSQSVVKCRKVPHSVLKCRRVKMQLMTLYDGDPFSKKPRLLGLGENKAEAPFFWGLGEKANKLKFRQLTSVWCYFLLLTMIKPPNTCFEILP